MKPMENERSPYSTTIVNTVDLATYPGDSATTQTAIATVPGPTPPAPLADTPDASYTPGMTARLAQARATLQSREIRRIWVGLAVVLIIAAAIAVPRLQASVNANQSFYARAAGSFVGWVGTGPYGAKIAIQILPCQHSPCSNVTLDVAVQDAPLDTPRHYTLGGVYLGENELYISAFTSGGIVYSAEIITDRPVTNGITSGIAVLILKRGTNDERFNLTSATLDQISNYFGA